MIPPAIHRLSIGALLLLGSASCRVPEAGAQRLPALREVAANQLRAVSDFAVVPEQSERSRALFLEASRVLLHPRCANCHPSGDVPSQGMQMVSHQPPVTRGPDNRGVVGMECISCHQDRNPIAARVPGAPTGTWRRAKWPGWEDPPANL